MKRIFLFAVVVVIAASQGFAKDLEKEFRKIVEKYDVPTEVRDLKGNSAAPFWETLMKYDMSYRKLCMDMEKNKGAEKEAERCIELLPRFNAQYVDWVDSTAQNYCDSISRVLGLNEETPDFKLYFTNLSEPYSCSALGDDSFSVIVDRGLLDCKGFNEGMLMGIIAHEYSHGLLNHRLHNEYDMAKKKRRNRLTNSLIAGAVGVATIAVAATLDDGTRGIQGGSLYYVDNSVNINAGQENAVREITPYNYIFQKGQMLQADLIAFRLLEHLGYGGKEYINLLKLLENSQSQPDAYEDYILESGVKGYPSLRYRIRFLEYVASHPELGNKMNEKIEKKLIEKELRKKEAKVKDASL